MAKLTQLTDVITEGSREQYLASVQGPEIAGFMPLPADWRHGTFAARGQTPIIRELPAASGIRNTDSQSSAHRARRHLD